MRWTDGHLDLAYLATLGRDLNAPCTNPEAGCISLPDLKAGGFDLVFATLFTMRGGIQLGSHVTPTDDPSSYTAGDKEAARASAIRQLQVYEQLEASGLVRIVQNNGDLKSSFDGLKIVLLMEGADPIRDPADAVWWFSKGVRIVGLAWSVGTEYAGGNWTLGPITVEGLELVSALDDVGIIHDASHLCDESFDDLFEHAKGPIIASHSNSRTLVGDDNQRHLLDSQIRRIADRGGMIGINLFSGMLVAEGRATIADCLRHVEYIAQQAGGRRFVGLGSDMDGGLPPTHLPEDLDSPKKIGALAEALHEAGWGESDLKGFAHESWRAFLHKYLPAVD